MTTTEKKEVTFTLTDKTKFSEGSNAATKADLAEGVPVSVSGEIDGKTATSVKIGAAR